MVSAVGLPEVTPAAFERSLRSDTADAPLVLDVRDSGDTAAWPTPVDAARRLEIPLPALDADAVALVRERAGETPVLAVCGRGNRSQEATALLRAAGVEAASLEGGMAAWGRLLTPEVVVAVDGMVVLQLRREARGCLGYLLVAGAEAMAVDPTGDVAEYVRQADRYGARIVTVMDTHVHADHVSGAVRLARTASARLLVAEPALARGLDLADATVMRDGDELAVGPATVAVLSLPGHTTDMTGIVLPHRAGVIGGDSLFTDAVARPDLQSGDAGAAAAAAVLHETLHERLLPLGDSCVLLPGHYPGGRRAGPVRATLGELLDRLALLGLAQPAFVARVLADMPPRPANHEAIIAGNLVGDDSEADRLEIGVNGCAAGG